MDALERRADDHDKAIARAKELGMELQDAFAYIQKFSTSSATPMPPTLETPSGHSAAALVLVLKEYLDRIDKEETSSTGHSPPSLLTHPLLHVTGYQEI